jgi:DNA-binding PadR family transcriptional regulator
MRNGVLTQNEFWILDVIASERGEAYLASIRRIVKDEHGKDLSYGRQADILDKFERAGLVKFRWSEPTDKPGGRSKKLYTITGEGRAVLHRNALRETTDADPQKVGLKLGQLFGVGGWHV